MTWLSSCDGSGSLNRALPSGSAIDGLEIPVWTSVGGPTPGLLGGQPAPPRAPSPLASLLSTWNKASPPSMCMTAREPKLSSLVVDQPIVAPLSSGSIPHPHKISQGLLQASPACAACGAGSRRRCGRGAGGTCWGSRCECWSVTVGFSDLLAGLGGRHCRFAGL
jgi:hypothetical protein